MWEEINGLGNVKKCWRVATIPSPGTTMPRGQFVHKMTKNKIDRFKSRFVVDGNKQERGIDFGETFLPS